MNDSVPPRPAGTSREAKFYQWVHDTLLALRPIPTAGAQTNSTTRGFYILGKPEALPFSVIRCVIKSVAANHYVCRQMVGTTEGPGDISVARPPEQRNSIANETIDGVVYNYTYPTTVNRNSLSALTNLLEQEVIVPRILVNVTQIFAFRGDTGVLDPASGRAINLQDLNVGGRAWARG